MSDSYELTDVDAFTATAVGIPGARTFFLQVVSQETRVSFKCEKQHVEALAGALSSLLVDLPPVDAVQPTVAVPEPIRPAWTVGSIALGLDGPEGRIMVVLEEATEDEESGASARFAMTIGQARAFVEHGSELVSAGRPGCALCGSPIDVLGYHCTCFN
jgi:uncharacterized repeat protein (TIGR03847 family)